MTKVPLSELTDRMKRFRAKMDAEIPSWELAAFFGRVNQYYFTGTMQDGVLLVPRDGEAVLCIRRSFERACEESLFPTIRPMKSYKDALPFLPSAAARQVIHVETELVPLAMVQRFRKHFTCEKVAALDAQAQHRTRNLVGLARPKQRLQSRRESVWTNPSEQDQARDLTAIPLGSLLFAPKRLASALWTVPRLASAQKPRRNVPPAETHYRVCALLP